MIDYEEYLDDEEPDYSWIYEANRKSPMIDPVRTSATLVAGQDPFIPLSQIRAENGLFGDQSHDPTLLQLLDSALHYVESILGYYVRSHSIEHFYSEFSTQMRLLAEGTGVRIEFWDRENDRFSSVPLIFGLTSGRRIDNTGKYILYTIDSSVIEQLNDLIAESPVQASVRITIRTGVMRPDDRLYGNVCEALIYYINKSYLALREPVEFTQKKATILREVSDLLGIQGLLRRPGEQC